MIEHNTGEIEGKPIAREDQYHSPLARKVPYKYGPSDPRYDPDLCSWCQENPRIVVKPDVIIWCPRCYALQYERDDGTIIQHTTYAIGKDLIEIQKCEAKGNYKIEKTNFKVYKEE